MPDTDHSIGLSEQVDLINVYIAGWHDYGYDVPPSPTCNQIPPLGQRSKHAIVSCDKAMKVIQETISQLMALQIQLGLEMRLDAEARIGRRS